MKYFSPRKVDYKPYLIFDCVAKDDEDLKQRQLTNAIAEDALPEVKGGICVKDLDDKGNLINRDLQIIAEGELQEAKAKKTLEINEYDKSDRINSFSIQGISIWWSKNERLMLVRRFEVETSEEAINTNLWVGLTKITILLVTAKMLLEQLDSYAVKCFDVTASHKALIQSLTTLQEIESYDITTNYPN